LLHVSYKTMLYKIQKYHLGALEELRGIDGGEDGRAGEQASRAGGGEDS
jgi:hypothetical protein